MRRRSSAAPGRRPDGGLRAQGVIGWSALVAVLISALFLGANKPVTWTALSAVAMILFLAQAARDIAGPTPPSRALRLVPAALLYLGVLVWAAFQLSELAPSGWGDPGWASAPKGAAASPPMAIDAAEGRHVLMRLTAYAMFFWIAFRSAVDPRRARNFVRVIAVWSSALAVFGLVAALTRANPILAGVAEQRHDVLASFVNSNSYALYAAFGVLANLAALQIAFARLPDRRGRHQRLREVLEMLVSRGWIYLLGAAACIAAMTMTGSRAGTGAGLAGVAVFAAIMLWRRGAGRWGPAEFGALGAGVLIVLYLAASGVARVFEKAILTKAEEGRFLVYPRIVDMIGDRPWLGHGPGGFTDAFRAYVPPDAAVGDWLRAHNSYLENAAELGLPAAAAFYLALALLMWRTWRGAATRRSEIPVAALAFAAGVAGAAHSLVDFSLQMPATAALFATVLGVGWAQSFGDNRLRARPGVPAAES